MNLRIILADDHPFVLLGIRAALETHAGLTIVGEATTPTALIERLQRTPCDVLVTDLSMQERCGAVEDGLGLIRRIRCDWPRLRVVVVTALTNAEMLRAIVSDGEVSLLGKTESMDELRLAIGRSGHSEVYVGRSIVEALARPQDIDYQRPPVPRLSGRQAEIVKRFVGGQSILEIAAALGCHRRTVSRRKREAMAKLGVANDPGLFSYVRAYGIPDSESHS